MILILDHFDGNRPSRPGKLCAAPRSPEFCFTLMIPLRGSGGHPRQLITRKTRGAGALVQGGGREFHLRTASLVPTSSLAW